MKYYITTKVTGLGETQTTVSNSKGQEKVLSAGETYRLITEEQQEESMDRSVEISEREGKYLFGITKNLNRKIIVLN